MFVMSSHYLKAKKSLKLTTTHVLFLSAILRFYFSSHFDHSNTTNKLKGMMNLTSENVLTSKQKQWHGCIFIPNVSNFCAVNLSIQNSFDGADYDVCKNCRGQKMNDEGIF